MATLNAICKKRLIGDLKLIEKNPHDIIEIVPDEQNMLIWYFLVKGPKDSDYENGYYIGKLTHSPNYPFSPPDFIMLTPSGRFKIDKKICLTNTGFHSDEWSPMWTIHGILTGFVSIMLDDKEHGIAHTFSNKNERKTLALESLEYNKKHHSNILKYFTRFLDKDFNPINQTKLDEKPDEIQPNEKPDETGPNEKPVEMKPDEKPKQIQPNEKPVEMKPDEKPKQIQPNEKPVEMKPNEKPDEIQPNEKPGEIQANEKPEEIPCKKKYGRIKSNMMGKKVDGPLRTFITGDPMVHIEDLDVPKKKPGRPANKVTKPKPVPKGGKKNLVKPTSKGGKK